MSYTCTCFLLFSLLSCQRLAAVAARPAPAKTRPEKDRPNVAWRSFDRLLDARRGSHMPGLANLKRYFAQFGYLPEPDRKPTDAFDERLEKAVKLYQSRHGLPTTGRLDASTLDLIMSPRCGVGDKHETSILGPSQNGSVSRYTFFTGKPRWSRTNPFVLTYAISPTATIDYLPPVTVQAVFRRAFARWAQVIPVQFLETAEYHQADVKVGFYAGHHGDGEPFDGVLGVLAHAFSPESGRLHLDAAERWAVDFDIEKANAAVDLESVATHEIGHVLGLAHSALPEAVMYPSLRPRTRKVDLTVDDVEGVQALYGSNPQFSFSSLSEPDTSSAAAPAERARSSWFLRTSMFGVGLVVVILRTSNL